MIKYYMPHPCVEYLNILKRIQEGFRIKSFYKFALVYLQNDKINNNLRRERREELSRIVFGRPHYGETVEILPDYLDNPDYIVLE